MNRRVTKSRSHSNRVAPAVRRDRRRGGMAVVLVLGLISIALAVSFVMMRNQAMTLQLEGNAARQSAARQAAGAGISAALQKMHGSNWSGVDTTLTAAINATDSYEVTFITGDPSLAAGDPKWALYPYRVTINATGYAADPGNPSLRAVHRARAVVQLIPRRLSSRPANWTGVQNNTIYQWHSSPVIVEMPFRAEGSVHLQGALDLFDDYPHVSKPFNGAIDEVAIFDKSLTAAEILAVYNAATQAPNGSDAVATAYAAHNPVHWWRFDEAAGALTAVDRAGGQHGEYVGAVAGQPGAPNGTPTMAASFDGLNDFVDVGRFDVTGDRLTILAWINVHDFGSGDGRIISKATGSDTSEHYWMLSTINIWGNNRLRFRLRTQGSTSTLIAGSGNLATNQWILAAAVYDGNSMLLYRNGTEVGSQSKSGNINTNPDAPVYIGDNPPGSSRARYLRDLERMHSAGVADYRTFSGPIDMPISASPDADVSLLQDDLKLTLNDIPGNTSSPLSHPGVVASYRLYPGGKLYTTTVLGGTTLSNTSLLPDMTANPLGIVNVGGEIKVYDNVTIQGTLITNSGSTSPDLRVYGTNVNLMPAVLPALDGSNQVLELPVAWIKDDVRIENNSDSTFHGFLAVGDEFEIKQGHDTVRHELEGRLVTRELKVRRRDEWLRDTTWWRGAAGAFVQQLNDAGAALYFPQWLESTHNLQAKPRLQIRPPAQAVDYHWQDWSVPLFVADPNDGGLRWELIEWMDDL